jgi:hypothetical protein
MTETTTRTRANAVITVHTYEPAAFDEQAEGPALIERGHGAASALL